MNGKRYGGKGRKTLKDIKYYPSPSELYQLITENTGWHYKTKSDFYHTRDRSLVALLYLAALRVSEALRIKKSQFHERKGYIHIRSIKLSKSRVEGQPRRIQYRDARLPLKGERAPLTELIMDYVALLEKDQRLYPWSLKKNKYGQIAGCKRAWQIVKSLLPEFTCHWLRAFGEDYLYDEWDYDLLAVSDYVKVDSRTLEEYLRKRHEKYPAV
jgi:integrase